MFVQHERPSLSFGPWRRGSWILHHEASNVIINTIITSVSKPLLLKQNKKHIGKKLRQFSHLYFTLNSLNNQYLYWYHKMTCNQSFNLRPHCTHGEVLNDYLTTVKGNEKKKKRLFVVESNHTFLVESLQRWVSFRHEESSGLSPDEKTRLFISLIGKQD